MRAISDGEGENSRIHVRVHMDHRINKTIREKCGPGWRILIRAPRHQIKLGKAK